MQFGGIGCLYAIWGLCITNDNLCISFKRDNLDLDLVYGPFCQLSFGFWSLEFAAGALAVALAPAVIIPVLV